MQQEHVVQLAWLRWVTCVTNWALSPVQTPPSTCFGIPSTPQRKQILLLLITRSRIPYLGSCNLSLYCSAWNHKCCFHYSYTKLLYKLQANKLRSCSPKWRAFPHIWFSCSSPNQLLYLHSSSKYTMSYMPNYSWWDQKKNNREHGVCTLGSVHRDTQQGVHIYVMTYRWRDFYDLVCHWDDMKVIRKSSKE